MSKLYLNDLEKKIKDLKEISELLGTDLSEEISIIKEKIQRAKEENEETDSWERVKTARHMERPRTKEYIEIITDSFIELHGDRRFSDDKSIIGGIGKIENIPVTIIGHQKGRSTEENIERNFGMPNPEGYRKALRLMKQAEKFNRPIINFIDTPGAYCGLGAEERGQAQAIAENLLEMSRLKVPTISIVIGEGGSGGALALGVADKIAMLENSIYSVISPEGLASILWKDAKNAPKAAEVMKLTAENLLELEVIDDIINEPLGGAHESKEDMAENIKAYILKSLDELSNFNHMTVEKRYEKIRNMGKYSRIDEKKNDED
ncbi:MAG: acetyl-CoA carboxylase carboxyltransferase subunit alpha [Andreesenia angusta]|nr:acetyl-CoA carboxylase carboxyltransferase subunit alpha [Andreesenia angusta]